MTFFCKRNLAWFFGRLFYTSCVLSSYGALFKKQQRLQGKEVRFLTKKRQVFSQGLFTIFFVEQYPNRHFHQLSFHIPLLVSKRAVVRHKVKRILIQAFENQLPTLDFGGKFYKCFITLHKMKLDPLLKLLEEKSDTKLKTYLQDQHIQTFSSFAHFLWKKLEPKKPLSQPNIQ